MIATERHRNTSFTNARMYGRLGSSSNVGLRSAPTTRSSSSQAGISVSGKARIARTAVMSVLLDVSLPAPKRLPAKPEISWGFKLYFGASLNRNLE